MDRTYHPKDFDTIIRQLTVRNVALWHELPDVMPEFSRRFAPWQQRENERQLELHLKGMPTSFGMYEALPDADKAHVSLDVMKAIVGSSLLSHEVLSDKYFEESEKVTKRFMKEAREFDPTLSENDIHQALRNLWVFNSIQMYLGRRIMLTPSSFAYSLLYPYADNGLDSGARTKEEKKGLVCWLSKWFEINGCEAIDDLTAKIAGLLSMIGEEYPRDAFPEVHRSLLAIHMAQQKSLLLHESCLDADDADLIAITVEKGGTSVLADGYLAAGRLDAESADSLFEYGVVLQLVDDLQDLEEDKAADLVTPFRRAVEKGGIEGITRRLLHFAKRCAADLGGRDLQGARSIGEMIHASCTFLIMDAVAQHQESYTKSFLRTLEPFTPLRLGYLREMHREMKSGRVEEVRHVGLKEVSLS